ncbi:methyltransferase [Lactobacillus sp. PV037]|uniref:GIY-YIG nuclease family protein n=1 Tax=Lactobacillus sp. PV037 TaxID=2594496 RepID=UPI00223EC416|nr:GIY-YIG nuclease family protein [Lactobacillus sp. PV037]QNQ83847.1 methyltransferase [Lactobacillus sp. PV037]
MDLLKENERIDYLYSDDIQIIQDKDAFSFSLDTLLLAYFAKEKIHDSYKVVDLCSGNAAASLYMAYFNKAKYEAVEIQPEMADQAKRSIILNNLENRINVNTLNAINAPQKLGKDKYDMVVVNPPYFKAPKGHHLNPDKRKAIARHELEINLEQIISVASDLLKMKGKMFMVHRPERLGEIMHYCITHNLSVKNVQPFVSKRGEKTNLIVIEAIRNSATDGVELVDPILVHNADGEFTKEIKKIIRETPEAKREHDAIKKFYFYCLLCNDGSFYGGFTTNLSQRIKTHNAGKGAKYTKARRPVKLIYFEEFKDKSDALKREYWFKHHSRKWKEEFLKSHNVNFSLK